MSLRLSFFVICLSLFGYISSSFADGEKGPDTAKMLSDARLTCVSEALQELGKPVDDNYLGFIGLIAREKAVLIKSIDDPALRAKNSTIRSGFDSVEVVRDDVIFTGAMNYQMQVIRLLTSAGYCAPGKMQSRNPSANYRDFLDRIKSGSTVASNIFTDPRNGALKELGVDARWGTVMKEYFSEAKMANNKDFLSAKFKERSDFYNEKRKSALRKGKDSPAPSSDLGLKSCYEDIESNYESTFSSAEEAYKLCDAVYFKCGIATTVPVGDERGEIYRKNSKGQEFRVGGDWCAQEFSKPKGYQSWNSPLNKGKPAAKDQTPEAKVAPK